MGRLLGGVPNIFQIEGYLGHLYTSFTGGSTVVLQPQLITAVGSPYHSVLVELGVLVISWAGLCDSSKCGQI